MFLNRQPKKLIFKNFKLFTFIVILFILYYFSTINQPLPTNNLSKTWYSENNISREEFIEKNIKPILGQPPSLQKEISPLIKINDLNFFYINPLNEKVPVIILNYPKQKRISNNLPSPGLVVAIHETNTVGGEEPCGQVGREEMFYGKMIADRGYIVVCPTLTFTGIRQPTNQWDTAEFYKKYPNWSAIGKDITEISWLIDSLSLSGFNVNHVALVGHSQGAIYSLFSAALDTRIHTVIANAGFVDFRKDPNPERWSRHSWYKALPYIPKNFTEAELVAAIAPRNALICNYLQDEILVATSPNDEIQDMMRKFSSINWAFFNGKHGWPTEVQQFALSWLSKKFPVNKISNN
ncbi:hypothetical protein H6G28_00370 [Nostoc sp. FACHB-190]|nr:hypothetical protein [Nostoc sp. FACHB-190]